MSVRPTTTLVRAQDALALSRSRAHSSQQLSLAVKSVEGSSPQILTQLKGCSDLAALRLLFSLCSSRAAAVSVLRYSTRGRAFYYDLRHVPLPAHLRTGSSHPLCARNARAGFSACVARPLAPTSSFAAPYSAPQPGKGGSVHADRSARADEIDVRSLGRG